ncbi:hypothetical protein [Bacillus sp. Hm123]|uniref:hypothetical protein n=1 Tax=Bacillus sp. Hm123 TaxID=3450745 RepID=UPI003F43C76B
MNIREALKGVTWKQAEYFKWKHDIRYQKQLPKKSKEDFLRMVDLKTLNSFIEWERTSEYKNLLLLLLESKVANDMEDIYKIVVDKAKEGDEKSIRLFLTMQKDIQANAKLANKAMIKEVVEDDEDELDLS